MMRNCCCGGGSPFSNNRAVTDCGEAKPVMRIMPIVHVFCCIIAFCLSACSASIHPVCKFTAANGQVVEVELRRYRDISLLIVAVTAPGKSTGYYQLAQCPRPTFGGLSLNVVSVDRIRFWLSVTSNEGAFTGYLDASDSSFYTADGRVEAASSTPDIRISAYKPAQLPPIPTGAISVYSGDVPER